MLALSSLVTVNAKSKQKSASASFIPMQSFRKDNPASPWDRPGMSNIITCGCLGSFKGISLKNPGCFTKYINMKTTNKASMVRRPACLRLNNNLAAYWYINKKTIKVSAAATNRRIHNSMKVNKMIIRTIREIDNEKAQAVW